MKDEAYLREWRQDGTVEDRRATRADMVRIWCRSVAFRVAHPRQNAELTRNLEALQREQVTERHPEYQPYRWEGVDRDGNPRSGETRMRDKTVPEMVKGFQESGYTELQVIRDGTEIEL